MFASISRSSSRVRNSYICSSCLDTLHAQSSARRTSLHHIIPTLRTQSAAFSSTILLKATGSKGTISCYAIKEALLKQDDGFINSLETMSEEDLKGKLQDLDILISRRANQVSREVYTALVAALPATFKEGLDRDYSLVGMRKLKERIIQAALVTDASGNDTAVSHHQGLMERLVNNEIFYFIKKWVYGDGQAATNTMQDEAIKLIENIKTLAIGQTQQETTASNKLRKQGAATMRATAFMLALKQKSPFEFDILANVKLQDKIAVIEEGMTPESAEQRDLPADLVSKLSRVFGSSVNPSPLSPRERMRLRREQSRTSTEESTENQRSELGTLEESLIDEDATSNTSNDQLATKGSKNSEDSLSEVSVSRKKKPSRKSQSLATAAEAKSKTSSQWKPETAVEFLSQLMEKQQIPNSDSLPGSKERALAILSTEASLTTSQKKDILKSLSTVNSKRPVKNLPARKAVKRAPKGKANKTTESFKTIVKLPSRIRVPQISLKSRRSRPLVIRKYIRRDPDTKYDAIQSPFANTMTIESMTADELQLVPVEKGELYVPNLSYGLERVLFNPGVYHLQDPRSGVFNFDPYLRSIMPVNEFDFEALKEYVTSSRDKVLLSKTMEEKKKYTGSTSSMTSALAHFHFLLSHWREINPGALSQNFPVDYLNFTQLQRAPVSIFLRYRDGVYAIDADKQFDTGNILMMLGKSMEKLLTLPNEDFEKYRKSNPEKVPEEARDGSEEFHYSTLGDFLLRSQLDAHDSRLPGTGMFDLKTRAVVSIRQDIEGYELGQGYEIRARFGKWESYEREYYDMIRAAFLKYSLQVRMGRMDGIFVAFHNITRIFGFQYIGIDEMDYALHGTHDPTIGDSEFKLSIGMLNKVLDRATEKYPKRSLRLHFETTQQEGQTPYMTILASPYEEEKIEKIQNTNKAQIEVLEKVLMGKEDVTSQSTGFEVQEKMDADGSEDIKSFSSSAIEDESEPIEEYVFLKDDDATSPLEDTAEITSEEPTPSESLDSAKNNHSADLIKDETVSGDDIAHEDKSNQESDVVRVEQDQDLGDEEANSGSDMATDDYIVDEDSGETIADELPVKQKLTDKKSWSQSPKFTQTVREEEIPSELMGMTLFIRNKVNGRYVQRPEQITKDDNWEVEYALTDLEESSVPQIYQKMRQRHAKIFSPRTIDEENRFIMELRERSRNGREWRAKEDEIERKRGIKILGVRDGKAMPAPETMWSHAGVDVNAGKHLPKAKLMKIMRKASHKTAKNALEDDAPEESGSPQKPIG